MKIRRLQQRHQAALGRHEKGAQHLVAQLDLGQTAGERIFVELAFEQHRQRDVVGGGFGVEQLRKKDPFLTEGRQRFGFGFSGQGGSDGHRGRSERCFDAGGEQVQGGGAVDGVERQLDAETFADTKDHPSGEQGMAAERKKMGIGIDFR